MAAITFRDDSRFTVRVLWAEDPKLFQIVFFVSLVQFKTLEKRVGQDLINKEHYASGSSDNFENGYVVPVRAHHPNSWKVRLNLRQRQD